MVQLEANVLCLVHVSVERRITLFAHVQAVFNTLTLIFRTAHATRLTRVALGDFHDFDSFDFRIVGENLGEAVERPPVQVEVAVLAPVLRVAVLILTDAAQRTNVDVTHASLDTLLYDVLGKIMEEGGGRPTICCEVWWPQNRLNRRIRLWNPNRRFD